MQNPVESLLVEDSTGVQGACILDGSTDHEIDNVHHREEDAYPEAIRQTLHGLGERLLQRGQDHLD